MVRQMERIPSSDQKFKLILPCEMCADFVRQSLAGRAVCFARFVQASDEKSRQKFVPSYRQSQISVTPFALGRPFVLFTCGGHGGLTSQTVLALTSGSLSPCGAQRCRPRSYCLCAPLTHWLPPQPRTPVRTRLPALSQWLD